MEAKTNSYPKHHLGTIGKIIISEELEGIINTLHSKVGSTEWSGVLFYNLTGGNISKLKDLEFTANFMYPMNIGNTAYTEFNYDGKLMDAYDIKEDLITCESGMIHTHHNMNAFFSGTDIDELVSNAKQFNYYVSLVVNFAKGYVCKIIFPSKSVTNKTYNITNENGELIKINTKEEVTEYLEGDLEIEFKNKNNSDDWLISKIEELEAIKKASLAVINPKFNTRINSGGSQQQELFKGSEDDIYEGWSYPKPFINNDITIQNFLSAILSLDSNEIDGNIADLLEDAVNLNKVDSQKYIDSIDENIEIIYVNLYTEDDQYIRFIQRCKQAAGILDTYKKYANKEFVKKLNIILS